MGLITVEKFITQSFDYIIVGGGTAGLAVAARLSEDPNIRVGVIEAGSARLDDKNILTPGLSLSILGNPEYDWAFATTPQKHCNDNVVQQYRGRVLGGTSAINFLMSSQTTRRDLDDWEKLGNRGWSWDNLMPYYRKAETFHRPTEAARNSFPVEAGYLDPSLRGTDGPIQTLLPDKDNFVSMTWTESCKNACLNLGKPLSDPRSGSCLGGFNQLKVVDPETGNRSYSANSYFTPNADRPNFLVLTDAIVERAILEKSVEGYIATGVEFISHEKKYFARATREVVVSCGTFQSPQVLELSGIGSAEILKQSHIEAKVDNPNVGENFQEHVVGVVTYELLDPELPKQDPPSFMTTANFSLDDITTNEPLELSTKGDEIAERADEYRLQRESICDPKQGVASFIGHAGAYPPPMFRISSTLSKPFSRGSVHIASSDPTKPPVIDPNYYSHPLDLEIMSRALLRSLDVAAAEPLCKYLKDDGHKPGMTRDTMVEVAKETVGTHFHPVGTCAMKPRENGGVLNERLVVYGTKNLRVVDASIFPLHVQGNPLSLVYAIAEKASDLIKEDQS